jgi:protocatechuate 3,4-dioxygenase beta subunit
MRKLALGAVLLLALVALTLLRWTSSEPALSSEPIPAPSPAVSDLRPAPVEELQSATVEATESEGRQELSSEGDAKDRAAEGWPRALVRGRVLDEHGAPLLGASVSLDTVGEPWVAPHEYDGEFPPTKAETGTDGRFEFDLPLPSSSWISLAVSHLPFHVRAGRDFGLAGGRNQPPLLPGENDLGDFVLADAGGFRGRVSAEDGRPIAGARVSLAGVFPGGYSVGAQSDESGAYLVGGVPPGRYQVSARAKGYLIQERDSIDVERGLISEGPEFQLSLAATISGRVIDQDGAALAGVKLWGWPAGGGRGAGGRTAEDGSFRISLPQQEPYSLGAELEGYDPIHDSRSELYSPGQAGIELVMHRQDLATFRLRDARSGEPVERFGLKILRVRTQGGSIGSSADREPAPLRDYAGGEARLAADPRWDDYTVVAPGYGDQRGRVEWDTATDDRMTVELEPEGILKGRATSGGSASATPIVELRAARIPLKPGVTEGEDDIFSRDWGEDLDRFTGRIQQFTGGSDGRFELRSLAAGTYRLVLSARERAPRTLDRVVVRAGEITDLGDVELFGPSSLSGRVLLGSVSPAGISLALGDADFRDDESAVTLDQSGAFRFGDLPAGKVYLWPEPRTGVLLPGPPIEFELEDGEERIVDLDLSQRAPCRLEVLVRLNGEPASGVLVEARLASNLKRTVGEIAWSNDEGIALVDAPGTGRALLVLSGAKNLRIGRTTESVELVGGTTEAVEVEFTAGKIQLELPQDVPDGLLLFRVVSAGGDPARAPTAFFKPGEVTEGPLDLGWVRPGSYSIELLGQEQSARGEVTVIAGETATCTLSR